jgi:microcystin-dependent protein
MKYLLFMLSLLVFTTQANAQCDHCNMVLNRDIQDEFKEETESKLEEAYSNVFSKDYSFWENYESSSSESKSKKLDAAYKVFKLGFSSDKTSSSSQSKQKFEEMKEDFQTNQSLNTEHRNYLYKKVASQAILNAWVKCLEICQSGGIGISQTTNGDQFIVTIDWKPTQGSIAETSILDVICINAEYQDGELKKNTTLKPHSSLIGSFKILDESKPAIVIVSISNFGTKNITIPSQAVEEEKDWQTELAEMKAQLKEEMKAEMNTLKTMAKNSCPIGTILPFAGTIIPEGWKLCDGSKVKIATNQELFAVIGSYWGKTNGSTFQIPDLRGAFLRGFDDGKGVDAGREFASFQNDEFKSHRHQYQRLSDHQYKVGNGQTEARNPGNGHAWESPETDARGGNETRPKNYAINYIIRCQ